MESRSERSGLRHELKLVCEEAAWPRLRMLLRLDRAGIRTLFPARVVQSLYFDTTFQKALAENQAGISERVKLRLRWYGEATKRVAGVLEQKCRRNSLGWKESAPLADPLDVAGAERRSLMNELVRRCDARWRARLADHEPAQWVRYRREYFTSADRRVRLTVDRELHFADQRPRARLDDRVRTPTPRVLVLELKCAPEHLDRAQEIVARLPLVLGRCSKFALASQTSSGPLASQLGD